MLTVGGATGGNGGTDGGGAEPDSPPESPDARIGVVDDVASGFARECSLLQISFYLNKIPS